MLFWSMAEEWLAVAQQREIAALRQMTSMQRREGNVEGETEGEDVEAHQDGDRERSAEVATDDPVEDPPDTIGRPAAV